MLIRHQRVRNGLLFARRIAQRFIGEEWLLGDPARIGLEANHRLSTITVHGESDTVLRRSD